MNFASLSLCLFTVCVSPLALGAQKTPSTSLPIAPEINLNYPDNPGGLEKLAKDILKAQKESNTVLAGQLLQSLILPNPRSWYAENFILAAAADGAAEYEAASKIIPTQIGTFLLDLHRNNATNPTAVRFEKSCDENTSVPVFNALQDRITFMPLYELLFFNGDKFYRLALFAFVDGGFRFIVLPKSTGRRFSAPKEAVKGEKKKKESDSERMPVRMGGNVTAAKLLHKVTPNYPERARLERLQGTVRLHAIIAKDGSIALLRLQEGVCSLALASIDAVRQWRYVPTLLGGQPVEVDTTIDVIFSLNR